MADTLFFREFLYEEKKRFFAKYDDLLHKIRTGPHYLKEPEIAKIVQDELHRYDENLYDLVAYCIMSNHVHILIDTQVQLTDDFEDTAWELQDFEPLCNIMKRIKGPSAIYINRLLGRSGKVWTRESYDHYVRNVRELQRIIAYILNNPVKAGLVKNWEEWPYTYLRAA